MMNYRNILLLLVGWSFAACNQVNQAELKKLQDELGKAKQLIEELQAPNEVGGELVHMVYLKLKPEAKVAEIIEEIEKIRAIEEVHELEVGLFEDLGDERALSDYQIVFQMSFEDADQYAVYQVHPVHLALRKSLMPVLAGPPATYDYLKK